MRTLISGTGLLISLVATVLGAPVALAGATVDGDPEPPFLAAMDDQLTPGQELHIQGYCPESEVDALTSSVLTDIDILHDPAAGPPNLLADGVVAAGTAPGEYPVTMDCAGHEYRTMFTVVEPDDPADGPPADFLAVIPAVARPGDQVRAQATCDRTDETLLTSPVLRTATLVPDPEGHQPWALQGSTTVAADAAPGEYPVTVECWGGLVETTITVPGDTNGDGDDDGGDGDGNRRDASRGDGDQVTRVPKGAPETGDGTREPTLPLLAVGLGLGAVAGTGMVARRAVRRAVSR